MITEKQKIKISDIFVNPNNPRKITQDQLDKLKKSITDFPEMLDLRPIIVDENNIVLGGNMRLQALIQLGYKEVNYIKVTDLTDEQKEQFVIKDNLSFGEWDWEQLTTDWDSNLLEDWGMDIVEWDEHTEQQETENPYTKKVQAPIYVPNTEVKPEFTDTYDKTRYDELVKKIESSSVDSEMKDYLKFAALRHIVFNYEKIADLYSHSDAETQNLMEASALVIIDFDRAIELGYIKLGDQLTDEYHETKNNEYEV